MRKVRMICSVLLLVMITGGCSLSEFPGDAYTEAVMDYYYKGEQEDYRTLTREDKEVIQKQYEESITAQKEAYLSYFGLDTVTEEAGRKLEKFVKMVYEYASYEITDCVFKENEQIITVSVCPIAFYKLAGREVSEYIEQFRQKTEDGEYLYQNEEEYQSVYLEGLLKLYEKRLEDIEYLEKQDYTVTLHRSGKEYVADEDAFEKIDAAVIAFSEE